MVYIRRLRWDPGNIAHIARHQVSPEEVEQVCHSEHIRRSAYAGRIMVIGRTQAGRTLSVVLDPEGDDAYYVVTARPSSRKERRIYSSAGGGESQ
jgi:uncharacterized DUF497 family protein